MAPSRTGAPSLHYDYSWHRPIMDQEELLLHGFPIKSRAMEENGTDHGLLPTFLRP